MCWIVTDLNPVSEKSHITFPNLQTACRIHTATCAIRKNATKCYKENCQSTLYVKLLPCVIRKTAKVYTYKFQHVLYIKPPPCTIQKKDQPVLQAKLPLCIYVKMPPYVTRKTTTLYHTYKFQLVL